MGILVCFNRYNCYEMPVKIRLAISSLIVAIGVYCLVWGFTPLRYKTQLIQLNAPISSTSDGILENASNLWEVGIELPLQLRLGETAIIELWIREKDSVDAGQAEELEKLYAEYQPIAQARLELVGAEFAPQGQISQAMEMSKVKHFFWQIQAVEPEVMVGTMWLHILYLPLSTEKGEERRLILAYPLELPVRNLAGLGVLPVQVIGIVVTITGSVFLFFSIRAWLTYRNRSN